MWSASDFAFGGNLLLRNQEEEHNRDRAAGGGGANLVLTVLKEEWVEGETEGEQAALGVVEDVEEGRGGRCSCTSHLA